MKINVLDTGKYMSILAMYNIQFHLDLGIDKSVIRRIPFTRKYYLSDWKRPSIPSIPRFEDKHSKIMKPIYIVILIRFL